MNNPTFQQVLDNLPEHCSYTFYFKACVDDGEETIRLDTLPASEHVKFAPEDVFWTIYAHTWTDKFRNMWGPSYAVGDFDSVEEMELIMKQLEERARDVSRMTKRHRISKEQEYEVVWRIQVTADSPKTAAENAMAIMRVQVDPHFEVKRGRELVHIDFMHDE